MRAIMIHHLYGPGRRLEERFIDDHHIIVRWCVASDLITYAARHSVKNGVPVEYELSGSAHGKPLAGGWALRGWALIMHNSHSESVGCTYCYLLIIDSLLLLTMNHEYESDHCSLSWRIKFTDYCCSALSRS